MYKNSSCNGSVAIAKDEDHYLYATYNKLTKRHHQVGKNSEFDAGANEHYHKILVLKHVLKIGEWLAVSSTHQISLREYS